jgi:hypothetical protein
VVRADEKVLDSMAKPAIAIREEALSEDEPSWIELFSDQKRSLPFPEKMKKPKAGSSKPQQVKTRPVSL